MSPATIRYVHWGHVDLVAQTARATKIIGTMKSVERARHGMPGSYTIKNPDWEVRIGRKKARRYKNRDEAYAYLEREMERINGKGPRQA